MTTTADFHCGAQARAIQAAIGERIRGIVQPFDQLDIGELLFTHPLHETLVRITVQAPEPPFSTPTTTLRVMLYDLDAAPDPTEAIERALSANMHLMGCATTVSPMDAYPRALVLVRRVPTEVLAPAEVLESVDDMLWEFLQLTTDNSEATADDSQATADSSTDPQSTP